MAYQENLESQPDEAVGPVDVVDVFVKDSYMSRSNGIMAAQEHNVAALAMQGSSWSRSRAHR